MNAKERIVTAMKGGQPDAVPVTLGLSEMVPVRESGLTYIEFFWREKRDIVRARCDVEKGYGADVFLHSEVGVSEGDPEVTQEVVREGEEEVVYREVIHTRRGDLSRLVRIGRTESPATLEGLVKDAEGDREKALALLTAPEGRDWGKYESDHRYVGEAGHCGLWLATPVDWWSDLRGGPERAIMDLMDRSEVMEGIFKEYTAYTRAMVRDFLARHHAIADSIGLGGSTTSMSVLSPTLLTATTVGFVRAMKEEAKRYGIPVQYHMCGRSREAIPILVEAGVDGMDALESPPTGNVDLGEVKRAFGDHISLRGNVNSITVMLRGGPGDVEREVARCMEDAKEGGGFILGVGDQTPYDTPDENICALVEAGRRLGKY